MINFTDNFRNPEDFKTERTKLFESFVLESGLPAEYAKPLFEADFALDDDIKPEVGLFQQFFNEFARVLETASKEAINEVIISLLTRTSSKSTYYELFKIVLYMLFIKDNVSYSRVSSRIKIDDKLWKLVDSNKPLYESISFDLEQFNPKPRKFDKVTESEDAEVMRIILQSSKEIPGFNVDVSNSDSLLFYRSLRDMLTNMNKVWGNNIEVESSYKYIVKYLTEQIEYLTNKDSIHSVDNSQIALIVQELVENRLAPHHKDINAIRHLVTDVQALAVELVDIVRIFMQTHGEIAQYISSDKTNEWVWSYNNINKHLVSSYGNGINKTLVSDYFENVTNHKNQTISGFSSFELKPYISYQTVQDALFLLKSMTPDFNLKLRNVLNNFITNSLSFSLRINNIRLKIADARLDHKLTF